MAAGPQAMRDLGSAVSFIDKDTMQPGPARCTRSAACEPLQCSLAVQQATIF